MKIFFSRRHVVKTDSFIGRGTVLTKKFLPVKKIKT